VSPILQHTATHCNTLQHTLHTRIVCVSLTLCVCETNRLLSVRPCLCLCLTATHHNAATHCNTRIQCVSQTLRVCGRHRQLSVRPCLRLYPNATHYNTLQHTATHIAHTHRVCVTDTVCVRERETVERTPMSAFISHCNALQHCNTLHTHIKCVSLTLSCVRETNTVECALCLW